MPSTGRVNARSFSILRNPAGGSNDARAKIKEEAARERFDILCGGSSRFTQT